MRRIKNRSRAFGPGVLAVLAGLLLTTAPAVAAESCCSKKKPAATDSQSTAPKDKDKETTPPAGQAGLRVYLDEQGRPTAPPKDAAPEAVVPAAFSTSAAGLRQVPSAGPAGGVKVNLEGRFRSASVATTAPDGSIQLHCVTGKE